ncbi:MAG: putative bifunctional diguanylate cyclase/phosphodiesterase [Acidimicrobiia bacterium]
MANGDPSTADATVHPLLARQLRRLRLDPHAAPDLEGWELLIDRVSNAYGESDQYRYLVERSMHISSTEMRELNESLKAEQIKSQAVFDSASVGLCVIAPDGAIEAVNPAAEAVLGRTEESLRGLRFWDAITVAPEARPDDVFDERQFEAAMNALTPWREDDALVSCGSRKFSAACVLTQLSDDAGRRSGAVLVLRDVTEHKLAQARLAWQAHHDTLTGLPNRSRIMTMLQSALVKGRNTPGQVGVLFIDLDRFKAVNDSLGHAIGDALLTQVVDRVGATVRGTDVVGRLAGDEFVVLCDGIDLTVASRIAQRIVSELEKPFVIDGNEVMVSASIGLALDGPDSTAVSLLGEADQAMYHAKQSGRSCVRVFDEALRFAAQHRLHLETSLRHAVREQQLQVAFQRQVSLADRQITGFELLARWTLPDGSSVPPRVFIPMAEDLGLIHELGAFMLDRTAEAYRDWVSRVPGLRLSVNVSGRQLQNRSFADRLAQLADEPGLDATAITLELTESVLLDDPDSTIRVLNRLREAGYRIAVDDFGTGYSSLSYLRRLPLDEVKIDQDFVSDLATSAQSRTVLESVVRMCHALGSVVVAEGVETIEQAQVLATLGCDIAQGWRFGHPETEHDARCAVGLSVIETA